MAYKIDFIRSFALSAKKALMIIAFVCCSAFTVFAEKQTAGLLFTSSERPINDRTTLSLFDNNLQEMEDRFAISFEFSIWDIKQFGYILRIINEKSQEIDFVFVNFRGDDNLYLDFHSPITHKSVPIPIHKKDIYERKWLPIRIEFDLKADRATVSFRDSTYTCEPVGLKNPSRIKFVYGLHGLNLDVPQMAIRDIKIEKKGKLAYDFPLDESAGEQVYDSDGNKAGRVKNPEWLVNRHHHWISQNIFRSDVAAGITYDPSGNRIFVLNKDSINIYYPSYERKETVSIKGFPFSIFSGEAVYMPKEDKCFIYNLGQKDSLMPSLAIVDMKDYSVEVRNPRMNNELHHHNAFLGNDGTHPYIFGGYGNYSYSNKIFGYNAGTDSWDSIRFSGDNIMPRFFSSVGAGLDSSKVLIMGGFGNESGRQEHGGRSLYDLFSVDLQQKSIRKLWELQNVSAGFVPCSNLILNKEKTHFYTLCYPHHQSNAVLSLYKFSVADGSYEIVSDSISLVPEKINTTVYLFYNEKMGEFYTVIREYVNDKESEIRIYSLLSPPIAMDYIGSRQSNSFQWLQWVGLSILLLLCMCVGFVFVRRRSSAKKLSLQDVVVPEEPLRERPLVKENAIYVFGEFTVFDKKGNDISYRFSSKIKSLFALILFYGQEHGGISTEMLTSELWPDKDSVNAKNTRGVTINRLRNILSDMDGIFLVYENYKWSFNLESSFYCDYIESLKIISEIQGLNQLDQNMHWLMSILKRGSLLPHIQENRMDVFKTEFENKTEKVLSEYILNLYKNKKYIQLIHYSELYFNIDPMNEEVMDLCLKAFQKMGKEEQVSILYRRFVSGNKNMAGEEARKEV